jgi:hypothetical protein
LNWEIGLFDANGLNFFECVVANALVVDKCSVEIGSAECTVCFLWAEAFGAVFWALNAVINDKIKILTFFAGAFESIKNSVLMAAGAI